MSKKNKIIHSNLDENYLFKFKHSLQHRFSKYLEKDHFQKMYDQFIENGDWSLISNEFFNYDVTINESDENRIINFCRDKEKIMNLN